MTTAAKRLVELAEQWREARKLYPIYSALLERFALGLPPCRELESPIDRNEPEAMQRAWNWFAQMDERVHVHQLRQLLQTTPLGTEDNLRALVSHHLEKDNKTDADRDKVDFVLVQYLSSCAPPAFYERTVEFEEVAQVLEPILGEVGLHPPQWMESLEEATNQLEAFRSLRDLLQEGTLERMRKLKSSAGEMYFGPTALVAITRFNFLVRRTFVRLIAADLHAIRFSLHELEQRGVTTVNCRTANLSAEEPIESLRQICQEWKKPFRAAYAAGQNFKELIEIRSAVEEALAHAPQAGSRPPVKPLSSEQAWQEAAAPHANNGMPGSETGEVAAPPTEATSASDSSQEQGTVTDFALPQAKGAQGGNAPIAVELQQIGSSATNAAKEPGLVGSAHTETPAKDTSATETLADLKAVVERISAELSTAGVKPGAVANVVVGGIKLMLSSWEVAAYAKKNDETSDVLQRAVAVRGLLMEQVERRKRGEDSSGLRPAIRTAHVESARIQARIAVAKEAKDIDAAVNLAATSKRLLALLDVAEKPAK